MRGAGALRRRNARLYTRPTEKGKGRVMSADGRVDVRARPGEGVLLAAEIRAGAEGRERRRDLSPLAHLLPFVRAHWGDAALSFGFLLLSTSASLALTW